MDQDPRAASAFMARLGRALAHADEVVRLGRTPHEPSQVCDPYQCYSHHVDEPLPADSFEVCGECFHSFPSARALRRDDRDVRVDMRLHGTSPRWRWLTRPLTRLALLLFDFRRASRIYVCPHCAHDL